MFEEQIGAYTVVEIFPTYENEEALRNDRIEIVQTLLKYFRQSDDKSETPEE